MTRYTDKRLRESLVTVLLVARQEGLLNDRLLGAVLERWDELTDASPAPHGGQGKGLKRKAADGTPICGRCGKPYDGITSHGRSHCKPVTA